MNNLVSVIMYCRNMDHFLTDAVESILFQKHRAFELIVIDHSLSDHGKDVFLGYNDSRIKHHKIDPRKGKSFALNAGMDYAQGKYITFAYSNSISLENRLQVQREYLESHPEITCIGSWCEDIDDKNNPIALLKSPLSHEEINVQLLKNNCVFLSSIMFRNQLSDNPRFDENYKHIDDYSFVYEMSRKYRIRNLDIVLVQLRDCQISNPHRGAKTHEDALNKLRKKQLEDLGLNFTRDGLLLHEKLLKGSYFEDSELEEAEEWLNNILEANTQFNIYHQESLYYFCQNLAYLAVNNNTLGGWSIERELLEYVQGFLPEGKSVLEFGSGKGTEALLKKYNVISIEHDVQFLVQRADHHQCLYAPIESGWYKINEVKRVIEESKYDLILVDGPPGELRNGILDHIKLFKKVSCPIIFDDMDRSLDLNTMAEFCQQLGLDYNLISGKTKIFAVCNPPS